MKLKKYFGKVLAVIVSITVCITLPAAEVFAEDSEMIYYIDEESTRTIILDVDELLAESGEIYLNSRSGTSLSASSKMYVSLGNFSAYQQVTIKVNWTPSTYSLYMGVKKSTASSVTLREKTGGSGTLTAQVSSSGTYYLVLYNPSSTKELTITKCTYTKL